MPAEEQAAQAAEWKGRPATQRQMAAVKFVVSQSDDPALKTEAGNIKTIGEANAFLNAHWKNVALEGPHADAKQYKKLFVPRAFAKTITEQKKDGTTFQKIIFTLPRGIIIDGRDVGGSKLSQNYSEQYQKQMARKTGGLSVYLPADSPVELYRRTADGQATITKVDPQALIDASIRHRQEYRQQQEQARQQNQNQKQDQQKQKQEKPQTRQAPDMTPLQKAQADRLAASLTEAAVAIGLTKEAIKIAAGPEHSRYQLQKPDGTWSAWHSIRNDSDVKSVRSSVAFMAHKNGIIKPQSRPEPKKTQEQPAPAVQTAAQARPQPGQHLDGFAVDPLIDRYAEKKGEDKKMSISRSAFGQLNGARADAAQQSGQSFPQPVREQTMRQGAR